MQNLNALRQEIFLESKTILEHLSSMASLEELLSHSNEIVKLNEKISFLKILADKQAYFETLIATSHEAPQLEEVYKEAQEAIVEASVDAQSKGPDFESEEDVLEISHPEIAEDAEEAIPEVEAPKTVGYLEDVISEESIDNEVIIEANTADADVENTSNEKPAELLAEPHEKIEVPAEMQDIRPETLEETTARAKEEKKIKLAHIKGLGVVPSLFDEQPSEIAHESGKAGKTEIKSHPAEVNVTPEKTRQEFRLDLNDKIAFTKILFGGSQVDLNNVINKLNTFQTLEDAKEYLSDEYYDRDWQKVDEYAQRLWSLVESKFM